MVSRTGGVVFDPVSGVDGTAELEVDDATADVVVVGAGGMISGKFLLRTALAAFLTIASWSRIGGTTDFVGWSTVKMKLRSIIRKLGCT